MDKKIINSLEIEKDDILFANKLGISSMLAALLRTRGISNINKAREFLYPEINFLTPIDSFINKNEVVERIKKAISNNETVVVYGDYDCDGVCGVSILYSYLKSKDVNVVYYIPNRHSDGYGLSIDALEKITEKFLPDLLITVDCGISSCEEVNYCNDVFGFDVIVTDHHILAENLPDCLIFSCKLTDERGDKNICGAGVALRLIEALEGDISSCKKYFDMAALATIADVVPLIGDNRIIAKFGLMLINSKRNKGIAALVNSCCKDIVKSYDVAFKLAPRINALGRIGVADNGVKLLISKDNEEIDLLVKQITETNIERQELTTGLQEACIDLLKDYDFNNKPVIILYNPYWHDGVLGITASHIAEIFNRPTLLFTKDKDGIYKGSGRSIKGINIYDCLKACQSFIEKFGGHSQACGLSVKVDLIDSFSEALNSYVKDKYSESIFDKPIVCDFYIKEEIDSTLTKELLLLEPFGEGNPKPIFKLNNLIESFMQIGDTQHIKFKRTGFECIGFNMLDKIDLINNASDKEFIADLGYSSFNGKEYAQAIIKKYYIKPYERIEEYLYTGIIKSEKEINIQYIQLETAIDFIKNENYSTCYLCYFIETANSFINITEKKGYSNNFIAFGNENELSRGRNTLILSPSKDIDLSFYKNIVYLDKPILINSTSEVIHTEKTNFYITNKIDKYKIFKDEVPNYQELGKIFTIIKNIITEKEQSVRELYSKISNNLSISYIKFCICIYTFIDLGIIIYNSNKRISIDTSVRNKLDNSCFYKLMIGETVE